VNSKTYSVWLRNSAKALPILLILLAGSEREASAYTDPGTGALILQMLAAGFVSAIFYVRKFTNWFKPKKKDPND
jgi:hypothetical protein